MEMELICSIPTSAWEMASRGVGISSTKHIRIYQKHMHSMDNWQLSTISQSSFSITREAH